MMWKHRLNVSILTNQKLSSVCLSSAAFWTRCGPDKAAEHLNRKNNEKKLNERVGFDSSKHDQVPQWKYDTHIHKPTYTMSPKSSPTHQQTRFFHQTHPSSHEAELLSLLEGCKVIEPVQAHTSGKVHREQVHHSFFNV